ncbi:MAG: sugar transferase [Candidatus Nomurabacteria bacterium]|nr:sugar transferase [Candidatus Nomurabacteria bacterium]USN88168.1 MAG: sugar transferase [Candidatus Nomurabacteria bacterium]
MGERTRELVQLVLGDIFFFIAALWLTLLVRYLSLPSYDLFVEHLGPFLTISTIWIFVFYIAGLYDKQTLFFKSFLLSRIINTQIVNGLIAALLFFIIPFGIAPKTNLVIYIFISIALFTWWRMSLFPRMVPETQHKAIILADGHEAIELVDEINNNSRYSYSFVRIIDEKTATETKDFENKLLNLIENEKIDIIVANPNSKYIATVLPKLFDLSFLKFELTFLDFNKVYEETFDRVPLSALRYEWFITNISQAKSLFYNFAKRSIDIVFALILMIPSLALFPFVAVAVKLEDNGDLFYTAERVGQFNRPINIYKIRTKNGADSGEEALKSELVDTKVGAFLRKTRIDELPQLINVLKGDLSFIGPRPEIPTLVKVYAEKVPYYNARHFIKPGLSGWAQINNFDVPRGGVDVERTMEKLSYDLFYLKRHSLTLDVQIALKTVATILMRTGT